MGNFKVLFQFLVNQGMHSGIICMTFEHVVKRRWEDVEGTWCEFDGFDKKWRMHVNYNLQELLNQKANISLKSDVVDTSLQGTKFNL